MPAQRASETPMCATSPKCAKPPDVARMGIFSKHAGIFTRTMRQSCAKEGKGSVRSAMFMRTCWADRTSQKVRSTHFSTTTTLRSTRAMSP